MDTEERFDTLAKNVTGRVGAGLNGTDRDLVFFDAWWLVLQAGVGGLIQWAGNSGRSRMLRTAHSLDRIGYGKALQVVRGFLKLVDETAIEGKEFETALRRVNINHPKIIAELDTAWEVCAEELRSRTLKWWDESIDE